LQPLGNPDVNPVVNPVDDVVDDDVVDDDVDDEKGYPQLALLLVGKAQEAERDVIEEGRLAQADVALLETAVADPQTELAEASPDVADKQYCLAPGIPLRAREPFHIFPVALL